MRKYKERVVANSAFELRIRAVYEGPSPHAMAPVVLMDVQASQTTWTQLEAGLQQMRVHWPNWCGDEPGRHGAERVAWLLAQWAKAALNAVRGFVNEAGAEARTADTVRVWLGYHDRRLSARAFRLALEAALAFGREPLDTAQLGRIEAALQALGRDTRVAHPDYQIRFVMQAAREKDVPVLPLVREQRVWQVGWGARRRVFFESASHSDSMIGAQVARNKSAAKRFLAAMGAPVVPHVLVAKDAELAAAAQEIGWPCVVKPLNLGGGRGVTADVRSMGALLPAVAYARRWTDGPVMVERHVEGNDHRLLVIGGRLVSAVSRSASSVVGDGRSTVRALIDDLNASRRQNQRDNQHWVPVVEDDVFGRHLADQSVGVQDVLPAGRSLTLRSISNVSMGGYLAYVSDHVHPSVRAMAESIARASGLNTIGLDYITTDIGRDWHEVPGAFVEFNATPGLDGLDVHPGRPSGWLWDVLLGDEVGRVPVVMVLMAHADWAAWRPALETLLAGHDMGGSGPEWVWANGMSWIAQRLKAHEAALAMLRHPTVERAVVVAVSQELVQFGFPLAGVEQLFVLNDALPPEWQAVAQRVAQRVVKFNGLQALEHGFLDWMDCERQTGDDVTDGV